MKKTLFLRDFLREGEAFAYSLHRAMAAARTEGASRLLLDGGTYTLDAVFCDERYLAYSNHNFNGPKRIGALIEDMTDFELDFGGATLISEGVLTPIAILRSHGVTVKNVTLENPRTDLLEVRVVAHGEGYIDTLPTYDMDAFHIVDGRLYAKHRDLLCYTYTNIEFNGENGSIEDGTGDHTLKARPSAELTYEMTEDGLLRIRGGKRTPPIGNILVFNAARRFGAGVFCEESEDVRLENVTVHSCFGMGLIAQLCRNITLDGFSTRRHGDQYHTANADATHFVNCEGLIRVENCHFEGQLDDALNIHGMYTRILRAEGCELLVREMHEDSRLIRIFRAGDRIAALRPDTLLPYAERTVREVEYVNADVVRLLLDEPVGEIAAGDDLEVISCMADLIFAHNTVKNNRARGMLIAARGRVLIEDCYFHVGGSSILFESDGSYWFESGATQDVTVRNCRFDRCKHSTWGAAIIACKPRERTEEGRYYHKSIAVEDNEFTDPCGMLAFFDNVERVRFKDNRITGGEAPAVRLSHVGNAELQEGVAVTEGA